jgi:hypothetical protein
VRLLVEKNTSTGMPGRQGQSFESGKFRARQIDVHLPIRSAQCPTV